jgi:hypothetical protein
MYPIDAIKVRMLSRVMISGVALTDHCPDPNADPQPNPISRLQWNDTRRLQNSHGGGNPQLMERHVQCGGWSRYVYQ